MNFLNPFPAGELDKQEVNEKLQQSSAYNKLQLLHGYEGVWIQARRNNCYYILNKLTSMSLGLIFAALTLSFKRTTYIYYNQELEDYKFAVSQNIQ